MNNSKELLYSTQGSVGISVAMRFYGAQCVVNVGDYYHPGTVAIPKEDYDTYLELVQYAIDKFKAGGRVE